MQRWHKTLNFTEKSIIAQLDSVKYKQNTIYIFSRIPNPIHKINVSLLKEKIIQDTSFNIMKEGT